MPSSLVLTGGAAYTRTIKETVTQTNHGFTFGDVLRWNTSVSPPKYAKALADNAINSEVVGIVNDVFGPDNFELTYSGVVDLNLPGLDTAHVLYLSSVQGGSLDVSPPSAIGSVIKPVLTKNKDSSYVVNNFLGTQIGGSSTVAVEEIQPVGTIMPFAGLEIPATWLPCDGSEYNKTEYPELYAKLCFASGNQVPMYGFVFGITGGAASAGYANIALGDVVHFKSSVSAWAPQSPLTPFDPTSNDLVRATVVGLPSSSNRYLQLSVIPKYSSGNFSYPNEIMTTITTNTNNYRVFRNTSAGWISVNISGFVVTQSTITKFKTPDLRGRFALGTNTIAQPDGAIESEPSFISSIGTYSMGSLGGEELHTLTSAEMPSHSHPTDTSGSGYTTTPAGYNMLMRRSPGGSNTPLGFDASAGEMDISSGGVLNLNIQVSTQNVGSNTPHNNMPPYTTVMYIIKAKPYARAAIIDGVDIPYSNLLIRDLRSRNIGGSNSDLVMYTNTDGDSGTGTERIRILGSNGSVGIGKVPGVSLDVNGTAAFSSRVGIGKTNPQVALDVAGHVRSSILLTEYEAADNSTLTTKGYVNDLITSSGSENGYVRVGNVLIQWGRVLFDSTAIVSGDNRLKEFSFSRSFSSIPWSVVATAHLVNASNVSIANWGNADLDKIAQIRTITSTGAEAILQGIMGSPNSVIWVNWMAVGPW